MTETHKGYRPDIDVLRALAVFVVILFHGQIGFFAGGFVGVDVFFVISGFLITRIILKQLNLRTFNLRSFYLSRARRIIPALFVMLILVAIVCYALSVYYFKDFKSFRLSVRSALLFYSNIYFYRNTGYFDTSAITQVLLHTWSLGVEAQFYFVYPLILLFFHRIRSTGLAPLLFGSVVTLFTISGFFVAAYPDAGFYLFPFRAWELFLGGWLAASGATPHSQKNKKLFIVIGMLCILASSVLFNNIIAAHTPGVWALLPCIGASLVISGGNSFTSKGIIFSIIHSKQLLHLGLISYSLYLWHWPVFALYRLLSYTQKISFVVFLLLLAPVFLCAHYSWKFIEQPVRQKLSKWTLSKQFTIFTFCTLAALIPTKLVRSPHGYLTNEQYLAGELDRCKLTNKNTLGIYGEPTQFLVLGDSHAQAMGCLFSKIAKESEIAGRLFVSDGLINGRRVRVKDYEETNRQIKDIVKHSKWESVFIISRWALGIKGYLPAESLTPSLDTLGYVYENKGKKLYGAEAIEETLIDTVSYLEECGVKSIYIVLPIPECGVEIPRTASRVSIFAGEDAINKRLGVSVSDYQERNKEVLLILKGIAEKFNAVTLIAQPRFYFPMEIEVLSSKMVNLFIGMMTICR